MILDDVMGRDHCEATMQQLVKESTAVTQEQMDEEVYVLLQKSVNLLLRSDNILIVYLPILSWSMEGKS